MKIALISDIHGNNVALNTVLKDLEHQNVDKLICLGDVATIGPQPKQVLDTLQTLDCVFIQGNHDAAILNPQKANDYNIHPALHANLNWVIDQLTPQELAFFERFQFTYSTDLDTEKGLLCFHASPKSNIDIILPTTPNETLDNLFASMTADIMAGGHTHRQMLRKFKDHLLVNPGSVGTSFAEPPPSDVPILSPWAEYAVIECLNGAIRTNLYRLPMDVEAVYEAVRNSQMPNSEYWLAQYQD